GALNSTDISGDAVVSGCFSRRDTAVMWDLPVGFDSTAAARAARQGDSMIARLLRSALRGYRWFVSPVLPASCRFHPSCSEYAEQGLARHGAWRGSWLAARRLCRCGPWHPGGYDPVPCGWTRNGSFRCSSSTVPCSCL